MHIGFSVLLAADKCLWWWEGNTASVRNLFSNVTRALQLSDAAHKHIIYGRQHYCCHNLLREMCWALDIAFPSTAIYNRLDTEAKTFDFPSSGFDCCNKPFYPVAAAERLIRTIEFVYDSNNANNVRNRQVCP